MYMTVLVITASATWGPYMLVRDKRENIHNRPASLRLPTFLLFARNYLAHHPFVVNDPDITWRSQSTVLVGESGAGPEA